MKNAYILNLKGQGDHYCQLIDQETWDWINMESGQPDEKSNRPSCWIDTLCPKSILERIENDWWTPSGGKFPGVQISIGSWENDRALYAPALDDNKDDFLIFDPTFNDLKEMEKKANKLGYKISDEEYDGYIY